MVKISSIFVAFLENTNFTYFFYIMLITYPCPIFDDIPKGQLISKCLFGVIVWTKIATKYCQYFCPEIFCSFLGAPGSFLGLPVGFLLNDIIY